MGGRFYLKPGGMPHLKTLEGQFWETPPSKVSSDSSSGQTPWLGFSSDGSSDFSKLDKNGVDDAAKVGMLAAGSKMTQSRWRRGRERGGHLTRGHLLPQLFNSCLVKI